MGAVLNLVLEKRHVEDTCHHAAVSCVWVVSLERKALTDVGADVNVDI